MEDDTDIYADLPDFRTNNDDKPTIKYEALNLECLVLKKQVTELTTELEHVQQINKNLEVNLSSLLKTAKGEIGRKNRTIDELRKRLDNISFRRGNHRSTTCTCQTNQLKLPIVEPTFIKPLIVEHKMNITNSYKTIYEQVNVKEEVEKMIHVQQEPYGGEATVFGKRLRKRIIAKEEEEKMQKRVKQENEEEERKQKLVKQENVEEEKRQKRIKEEEEKRRKQQRIKEEEEEESKQKRIKQGEEGKRKQKQVKEEEEERRKQQHIKEEEEEKRKQKHIQEEEEEQRREKRIKEEEEEQRKQKQIKEQEEEQRKQKQIKEKEDEQRKEKRIREEEEEKRKQKRIKEEEEERRKQKRIMEEEEEKRKQKHIKEEEEISKQKRIKEEEEEKRKQKHIKEEEERSKQKRIKEEEEEKSKQKWIKEEQEERSKQKRIKEEEEEKRKQKQIKEEEEEKRKQQQIKEEEEERRKQQRIKEEEEEEKKQKRIKEEAEEQRKQKQIKQEEEDQRKQKQIKEEEEEKRKNKQLNQFVSDNDILLSNEEHITESEKDNSKLNIHNKENRTISIAQSNKEGSSVYNKITDTVYSNNITSTVDVNIDSEIQHNHISSRKIPAKRPNEDTTSNERNKRAKSSEYSYNINNNEEYRNSQTMLSQYHIPKKKNLKCTNSSTSIEHKNISKHTSSKTTDDQDNASSETTEKHIRSSPEGFLASYTDIEDSLYVPNSVKSRNNRDRPAADFKTDIRNKYGDHVDPYSPHSKTDNYRSNAIDNNSYVKNRDNDNYYNKNKFHRSNNRVFDTRHNERRYDRHRFTKYRDHHSAFEKHGDTRSREHDTKSNYTGNTYDLRGRLQRGRSRNDTNMDVNSSKHRDDKHLTQKWSSDRSLTPERRRSESLERRRDWHEDKSYKRKSNTVDKFCEDTKKNVSSSTVDLTNEKTPEHNSNMDEAKILEEGEIEDSPNCTPKKCDRKNIEMLHEIKVKHTVCSRSNASTCEVPLNDGTCAQLTEPIVTDAYKYETGGTETDPNRSGLLLDDTKNMNKLVSNVKIIKNVETTPDVCTRNHENALLSINETCTEKKSDEDKVQETETSLLPSTEDIKKLDDTVNILEYRDFKKSFHVKYSNAIEDSQTDDLLNLNNNVNRQTNVQYMDKTCKDEDDGVFKLPKCRPDALLDCQLRTKHSSQNVSRQTLHQTLVIDNRRCQTPFYRKITHSIDELHTILTEQSCIKNALVEESVDKNLLKDIVNLCPINNSNSENSVSVTTCKQDATVEKRTLHGVKQEYTIAKQVTKHAYVKCEQRCSSEGNAVEHTSKEHNVIVGNVRTLIQHVEESEMKSVTSVLESQPNSYAQNNDRAMEDQKSKNTLKTKNVPTRVQSKVIVLARRRKPVQLADNNACMTVIVNGNSFKSRSCSNNVPEANSLKPRACKVQRSYKNIAK